MAQPKNDIMRRTSRRGGRPKLHAILLVAMCSSPFSLGASAWAAGPDLIVGDVAANPVDPFLTFGPLDGVMAYGFSTTACNVGDAPVSWISAGAEEVRNRHPVIAQNMFRLKDGRFEQIGQSWLKHGFCGENEALCEPCLVENHTGCQSLAVGCSDPYGAELNTAFPTFHLFLGPKSDVNAASGAFPYSDTGICTWCPLPTFTDVDRRLQVQVSDVDPAMNPGARYFIEAQYVSPDEAAAGNATDNVSWREIAIDAITLEASAAPGSVTQRQAPAILAWQDADPSVTVSEVVIPDDGGPGFEGHFWMAANVTDLGGGWWHYEYAVQNVNSDRSAQTFSVPLPASAQVMNIGFHDVDYHSGERIDSTDWTHVRDGDFIRWSTSSYMEDEFANALRWGTLYNYRFDADVAPSSGNVELTLFKPDTPASVSTSTVTPSQGCGCPGDANGDALVDGHDIAAFVGMYVGHESPNACADVAPPIGGPLDADDVESFVALLLSGAGCG